VRGLGRSIGEPSSKFADIKSVSSLKSNFIWGIHGAVIC